MESSLNQTSKKIFNFDIEALRGVAAILVVWGHSFFAATQVDPGYLPRGIWIYTPPVHLSVIVFFFLSGYVIGLTQKTSLKIGTTIGYLKKRFVRLYPIFLVCLLLALVIARQPYPMASIVSHLSMTMGLTAPIITEISPAWSLTYEVLFYLLFIPVSILKINKLYIIICFMTFGILLTVFYRGGGWFLTSFCFGAVFWLSGLYLANNKWCSEELTKNYAKMASLLLVLLASEVLDAPATVFNSLSKMLFHSDLSALMAGQPIVAYRDLAYLPFCVVLIAAFAKIDFNHKIWVELVVLLAPAITYYHYLQIWDEHVSNVLVLPTIFYGLALLLYLFQSQLEKVAKVFIKSLIWTGGLSYGLYIFHYPILTYFHRTTYFSGSPLTFLTRLVLFAVVALAGAYFLEKMLQPQLKHWLLKK